MSRAKLKLNSMLKWRTKSTTDLSEWNKNDDKLLKAVESGSLHKVQSILHKKSSVNPSKLGPKGLSVFHIACEKGLLDIVDALIKNDADVNCLTIQGSSALHLAADHGWAGVIHKLLQAGASVDVQDSCSQVALHYACFSKSLECVQFLLHFRSNPNIRDSNGRSPLFVAVNYGSISICKELLDKGADVNLQDLSEMTPLMVACQQRNKEICEVLLKRGANREVTDVLDGGNETAERTYVNQTDVLAFEPESPGQSSKKDVSQISEKGSADEINEKLEKQKEENITLKKLHKELEEEHEKINEELHQEKLENKKLSEQLQSVQLWLKDKEDYIEAQKLNLQNVVKEPEKKENLESEDFEKVKESPKVLLETNVDSPRTSVKEEWGDSDDDLFSSADNLNSGKFSKEEQQTFSVLRKNIDDLTQENIKLKEQLQVQLEARNAIETDKASSPLRSETTRSDLYVESVNAELKEIIKDDASQNLADALQSLDSVLSESKGDEQESQKSNRSESPNSLFDHNIDESLRGLDPEVINFKMMESENSRLKQEYLALQRDLDRLQSNYSALVEAGDNLQDEYDQLLSEKEMLQVEFQKLSQDKEELVKENEFLLSDGNALHDDLEKLVHELEKVQGKYEKLKNEKGDGDNKTESAENDDVTKLTEQRDTLLKKCEELERLVESRREKDQSGGDGELQELCSRLEKERDDYKDNLEVLQCKFDSVDKQYLALKQDYSQLEQDFTDILAEKDRLERELNDNNSGQTEPKIDVLLEERDQLYAENNSITEEKEQLELTITELSKVNALLEERVSELELNVENFKNSEMNIGSPSAEKERRIRSLQIQISRLQQQLAESDRKNKDIINTYRTHLISAVQGHLDEGVKAAIHHIIELRSVEQFC